MGRIASVAKEPALNLTPEALDLLADAIAGRLADRLGSGTAAGEPADSLLDAKEVARRCGRSRHWVYEHADELSVVRLGDTGKGKRPRLAFRAAGVEEYLDRHSATPATPEPATQPPRRRTRRAQTGQAVELLPIRRTAA